MNVRRHLTAAAAATALLGSALALAPAAGAATYPYQNWSQTSQNSSGVVFHPYGDKFDVWDNVRDDTRADVYFNYKGVSDSWKHVGYVYNGHTTITRNVYESINGKPAYIYFEVCDGVRGCSTPSWYRTWGS
jgi:hypothetical protein